MATKYFVEGDKLVTLSGDVEIVKKLDLKEISAKDYYALKLKFLKAACKAAGYKVKAKAIAFKESCVSAGAKAKVKMVKIKDAIKE